MSSRHAGAFVYRGAGKKQSEDAPPEQKACSKEACAIQWCLAKHNHKEKWCVATIDAWRQCCERVKAAAAARAAAEQLAAAADTRR